MRGLAQQPPEPVRDRRRRFQVRQRALKSGNANLARRCIVLIEYSTRNKFAYREHSAPFLSRFEKHAVSWTDVVDCNSDRKVRLSLERGSHV